MKSKNKIKNKILKNVKKNITNLVSEPVLVSRSGTGSGGYIRKLASKIFRHYPFYSQSADDDIANSHEQLMSVSREIYQNKSFTARAIIHRFRNGVVGKGRRPIPNIDYELLGISKEDGKEINKKIRKLWDLWANSTDCDATNNNNFYMLQDTAFITSLIDGDAIATLPIIDDDSFGLKINLIDSYRVRTPHSLLNNKDGKKIIGGIVVDEYGRSEQAYILNAEYDKNYSYTNINDYAIVDFYGRKSKRRNIIHLMHEQERPNQRRGLPLFAPVAKVIAQLASYSENEVMASLVATFYTVLFSKGPDEDAETPEFDGEIELGAGNQVNLNSGEKVEVLSANRSNQAYDKFMKAHLECLGAEVGLSAEVILSAFNSNYTAAKATLIECYKTYDKKALYLDTQFNQPIYEEFINYCVSQKLLILPKFHQSKLFKKCYYKAMWQGDARESINPLQEAKAKTEEMNGLRTSLTKEMSKQGTNLEDHLVEVSNENELLQELNLAITKTEEKKEESKDEE